MWCVAIQDNDEPCVYFDAPEEAARLIYDIARKRLKTAGSITLFDGDGRLVERRGIDRLGYPFLQRTEVCRVL